jgi:hypothetical protein
MPVKGRKVRKLDGTILHEAGDKVTFNAYWRRRQKEGDVTIVSDEAIVSTGAKRSAASTNKGA